MYLTHININKLIKTQYYLQDKNIIPLDVKKKKKLLDVINY